MKKLVKASELTEEMIARLAKELPATAKSLENK